MAGEHVDSVLSATAGQRARPAPVRARGLSTLSNGRAEGSPSPTQHVCVLVPASPAALCLG